MPKASIIMPVYNQALFLADSICSVLRQTEKDFEFIIVDDASTDGSCGISEFYSEVDPRIKLIKRKERGGQAVATNEGATHATGEYMAWHHGDDNYIPEFLEKTLAKKADVVFGSYRYITIGGQLENNPYDMDTFVWDREKFKKECYMSCCSMLYKRQAYLEVGGYDESFVTSVDWDFSLRVTKDRNVVVIPEALVHYRMLHGLSNRQRLSEEFRIIDRKRVRENGENGVY